MGGFPSKFPVLLRTQVTLYDLPLISADEAVVTLSDVADIQRTFKTRSGYSRMNGRRAITLQITKRTDANVIDTVAEVKQLINDSKPTFPQGVDVLIALINRSSRSSKWMSCRGISERRSVWS